MACDHLSEFLNLLTDRHDLARISVPVDAVAEIAAITQQAVAAQGPALLFDNVQNSQFPVVTNLLGTPRRLCWALGVSEVAEITARLKAIVQPNLPQGWFESLQLVPKFIESAKWPPRDVDVAVVQQVVKMGRDVNLFDFPFLRSWPHESLPVINSAQVIVEHPNDSDHSETALRDATILDEQLKQRSGRRLMSRTPIQVRDRSSCFVHWTPHSPEWQLLETYRQRGGHMPVAVVLGGDPILMYAADAPLPMPVDPLVFAGFLRRQPVSVTPARSINLRVPANAELILEGLIDPRQDFELAPPIGLSTGFYSAAQRLPVMQLTAVTHRSNPVIPAVIAAAPPSELDTLADLSQTIFLPLIQLAIPELINVRRPASGSFRHIAFASIRKSYLFQARKVMNALWGLDRLATTKLIVVVDEDVDVHNDSAVWFAVAANAHPGRDTLFSDGPADMQDHATPIRGIGTRMGLDATRKHPDEGHPRDWPLPLKFDDALVAQLAQKWQHATFLHDSDRNRLS